MRKNPYLINILLALLMTAAVLGILIARLVLPMVILPAWNIPNLIILCVLALVIGEYLGSEARGCWVLSALLAGLTIALLPFAAGLIPAGDALKLLVSGILVFMGCERMFTSIMDRLHSGPAGKLAPVSAGLTMCLMGQIFCGMFL